MRIAAEKRLLQAIVAVACLVPLSAGSTGVIEGAAWLQKSAVTTDLDSHFRYISGIFLGVGLAFASCVPEIERKAGRIAMLAGFVVIGGLARAWSAYEDGLPGFGHRFGLVMELGVTPLLALWVRGFAGRYQATD